MSLPVDTKLTNPKDAIGSGKLPLELVPDIAEVEMALAFLEGALKYGRFNWRVTGVRASIYYAAIKRHQKKWWNGQDRDKLTRVHHLGSIMACCSILLDAELCGKLNDDRPPAAPIDTRIDGYDAAIAHLKTIFAGHTPKQYTIADSEDCHDNQDQAEPQGLIAPGHEDACREADQFIQAALRGELRLPGCS